VFFSSAPSPAVLADIRQVPGLVARLKSLKSVRSRGYCTDDHDMQFSVCRRCVEQYCLDALQVSLEYSVVDRCAFSTTQERLLPALYGEAPDQEAIYEQQLRTASTRLVTLLAALKVTPATREFHWSQMCACLSNPRPHGSIVEADP